MSLCDLHSDTQYRFQGELFPALAEEVGPLSERHRHFVAVLDLVPLELFVHCDHSGVGRPLGDRNEMARADLSSHRSSAHHFRLKGTNDRRRSLV